MGADAETDILAATSAQAVWEAKYTFVKPEGDWTNIDYNDRSWQSGKGAFGYFDHNIPQAIIRTRWESDHIWLRREFVLEDDLSGKEVLLEHTNDDDAEIYINGVKVVSTGNVVIMNEIVKLPEEVIAVLRPGKNVISAYCTNRMRSAIIDFGLKLKKTLPPVLRQTAIQKSVDVQPTQTIYNFTCGPVDLQLTFTAPSLVDDLDLLSRPINYISYKVTPNDSEAHEVEIYFAAGTEWATSYDAQDVDFETFENGSLAYLKTGSRNQDVLGRNGSDYIDWGYFYLVTEKRNTCRAFGDYRKIRDSFTSGGLVDGDVERGADGKNHMAVSHTLGRVNNTVEGFLMIGYDDIYAVQYFEKDLRPYWNRQGNQNISQMFALAGKQYENIKERCDRFDSEMMSYAYSCGGKEYAELCALAYRQTLSAHKLLAKPDGELLFLSKSLSKTATVDVTYPSAPLYLLYNVELLKGMLNPIFDYAESGKWKFLFAPHDVGEYPHANGQQISDFYIFPVEESGNMLILTAAIATMEGNALYAEKHWNILSQWADFLLEEGFDPDNQLNTDNFAGYSVHNTNLSIKAILGIASYARLADMLGKNKIAKKYSTEARALALKWTEQADDGDHYRFAFDQPDTWSQKYNLVWDKIMKIDVFPHEVREKEVAYYLAKQNEFGLPLDSRHSYTKSDWIVWTATLSPNKETFQQFISPLYRFVNETPARVPMADWFWTKAPDPLGFQGRPVVGGYFIKMMEDKLINK